jgi:predicted nucleic acid-binding protein
MRMTAPGILVDTYTWIEISKNSSWGRQALTWIEKKPALFVSVLTLYELQYQFEDLYGQKRTGSFIATILNHVEVIPVDQQIATMAGVIKSREKKKGSSMGAVDCLILATARSHGLKILSGDKHFAVFEECLEISGT